MRPIAVFDIDGTLYRSNLLVDLVDALIELRIFPAKVAAIYRVVYEAWRKERHRGAYDKYMENLVTTYMRFIRGISVQELLEAVDLIAERAEGLMYVYGRQLVRELRSTHCLVAISGAPLEVVEKLTRPLGFEHFHGAEYEVANGAYTGDATPGHLHKDRTADAIARQWNLTFEGGVAMGDTHSDEPLPRLVAANGSPIAFSPNKELLEVAVREGWPIVTERKDVIYHLQGGRCNQVDPFTHYYAQ